MLQSRPDLRRVFLLVGDNARDLFGQTLGRQLVWKPLLNFSHGGLPVTFFQLSR
jgi:hypothetical protein